MAEEVKTNAGVDLAAVEARITHAIETNVTSQQDDAKTRLLEHLECNLMNLAKDYPNPRFLISKGGVGTLSRGDLQAIKAKSKNGKSQFVAILAAVALGAKFDDWAAEEEGLNVVSFDTEQNPRNVGKSGQKVHRLLNWDVKTNNPRFKCYALRADEVTQRRQEIVAYIREFKPDLAIIDGIADLTLDFNNIEESQSVIGEFMQVSTEVQCAILFVLHENKGKDDTNMKGHLGTMAVQKCSDVFRVTKTGSTFKVEQTESRNAPVDAFSFTLDENGTPKPLAMPDAPSKEQIKFNDILTLLQKIYGDEAIKTSSQIIEGCKNIESLSESTAKRRIRDAVSLQILEASAAGYVLLDRDKREVKGQ